MDAGPAKDDVGVGGRGIGIILENMRGDALSLQCLVERLAGEELRWINGGAFDGITGELIACV